MGWKLAYVVTGVALALSGCDKPGITEQVRGVEEYFAKNKVGASRDYLLVKSGLAGRDPVAVIFGLADDGMFCADLANLYMQKYTASSYYCEAAN